MYKKANSKHIFQLDFRRKILLTYLKRYSTAPMDAGRPSKSLSSSNSRFSDYVKYDCLNHLVSSTQGKERRRCAREECESIGRTMCVKFNV